MKSAMGTDQKASLGALCSEYILFATMQLEHWSASQCMQQNDALLRRQKFKKNIVAG